MTGDGIKITDLRKLSKLIKSSSAMPEIIDLCIDGTWYRYKLNEDRYECLGVIEVDDDSH